MKTSSYFEPLSEGRPRILAHRGLTFRNDRKVADENTLEAFENALSIGADYLESDIRVTRDGHAVLFHDPTLTPPSGKRVTLTKLNLNELQSIALPFGGRVPTLEEAIREFPNARFNLDLKVPEAIEPTIKLLSNSGAISRVLLTSFSESSRQEALAKLGQTIATSPGSSLVLRSWLASQQVGKNRFAKLISGLDAIQVPPKMYGIDFTRKNFIEAALDAELELHYWTINDPEQMKALVSAGATGIVTDRADLALATFS